MKNKVLTGLLLVLIGGWGVSRRRAPGVIIPVGKYLG